MTFCILLRANAYRNGGGQMAHLKKGILLGRIVGDVLTSDLIPPCYVNALKKAEEVAGNA
jgi:hypothetical protein